MYCIFIDLRRRELTLHICSLLENADGTGSTLLENADAYSPDAHSPVRACMSAIKIYE